MSKQYCPECHIEMDYKAKDEYWICPECGHTTDLDDVKLGIDYPTLESTYEDEEESYDPEAKYEDAYRRNEEFPGINYDELHGLLFLFFRKIYMLLYEKLYFRRIKS